MGMKIVTYNVNGLRSRVAQHGSLLKLLNSLDADIICFQETKLSRQDLSVDLTMAEGYEAFFSCTRTSKKGRSGYSGVATFCRVTSAFSSNEVALPLAAEEGFTGLLDCSRKRETTTRDLLEMPFKLVDLEDIKNEDLLKVDSEGRCVITDHGHFVLFNLYGPRAEDDDEERLNFKLLFFKILQKRWESLLNRGRRVFIAGDLNIAPAAIDKCDAHPDFELNMFREWLRSLLRECGGHFFDVFRSKYPGRKEAYTCFPQNVGAEEFNYGSRIDHIFIAGPCFHENHDVEGHNLLDCHVAECDILAQFTRGRADNAPKWKGGRSIKLEGSDHVPVYAILNDVPNLPVHSTPSLSVRYIPEVRGWQQTIVSLLAKRQVSRDFERNELSNFVPAANTTIENCHASGVSNQDFVPTSKFDKTPRKKGGHNTSFQLTLRSFFQQPESLMSADLEKSKANTSLSQVDIRHDGNDSSHAPEAAASESSMEVFEDENCKMNEGQCDMDLCSSSKTERDNVAILEWQRIQQKMKMTLPHCKGHGEPCVARSVKEGPNIGRRFYTCARAKGPASNPEANCDHFAWASVKFKKKQR